MKSFRLQNYRCFADTEEIRLRPLNILIGANGTGKSSFIKFFPLLKQSMRRHTNGMFLWYDDDVDFKDFKNALKEGAKTMEVSMTLPIVFREKNNRDNYIVDFTVSLTLESAPNYNAIVGNEEDEESRDNLKKAIIEFKGNRIEIELTNSLLGLSPAKLVINGTDFTSETAKAYIVNSDFLPSFLFRNEKDGYSHRSENAKEFLESSLRNKDGVVPSKIMDLFWQFDPYSEEELTRIRYTNIDVASIANQVMEIGIQYSTADSYLLYHLNFILESINNHLKTQASKIKYIQPLRAQAKRYYRYQNVSVEEIDSHGDNLAMYLYNLQGRRQNLNEWLSQHFGFTIAVTSRGGHIEVLIKEDDAIHYTNMVDTGFGYSQLLPIIVQIWSASFDGDVIRNVVARKFPNIIAIEQPELHLHPRMIGKFARMLGKVIAYSRKYDRQNIFLIETHSKTLVDTIGEMISDPLLTEVKEGEWRPEITSEDVQVLIFNRQEEEPTTKVSVSEYDSEGYLTNWPIGFFEPDVD